MRDVPGWETLYAATIDGRIWSHPKDVPVGIRGGIRHQPGRWLTLNPVGAKDPHLRVYLGRAGVKTPIMVHRLVAFCYIPNPDGLPHINHIDGNPTNNNVINLEWCTPKGNAVHAHRTGLTTTPDQTGSNNSRAKLTDDIVRVMRTMHSTGVSAASIARTLGVSPKTAYNAINGKTWGHIVTR